MRILTIIFYVFVSIGALAQSSLSFTYGVLPLEETEQKSYDKILGKKIQKEVLKHSPAEAIPNYSIVVRPELIIYSSDLSATAPQYYTSDMELVISISDYHNTVTFGSYDIPIKGAGRSKEKSIVNAVKSIKLGKGFSDFIVATNKEIEDYLKSKAESILLSAENSDATVNLDSKELSLLLSRLGMLMHFGIERERASDSIYDLQEDFEGNECKGARQQAKYLLGTDKFVELSTLVQKYKHCSSLIDYDELSVRYDDYSARKMKSIKYLDSLKMKRLDMDLSHKQTMNRNRSKGLDSLWESIGNLLNPF